ncbi:hypothetical protein DFJ74DRAFT_666551 [Hyaloraphidium curvatum]|nr:hypothetical protein DFJ74DRAFT_666551 [Hyaloraphidium curvatum]
MAPSTPALSELSIGPADYPSEDDAEMSHAWKGKERARIDSAVCIEEVDRWSLGEGEGETDPARAFPVEVFLHVLSFLPTPRDLAPCFRASRAWKAAAEDNGLWTRMTEALWSTKAYVPDRFRQILSRGRAKDAYRLSVRDSRRNCITKEELCMFEWQWRFKEDAGEHFTDEDPWWNGLPPRVRIFNPDGSMSGTFARPDVSWRFVNNAEGRRGRPGRFVRVGPYPASVLSRHSNWGWYMQSAWTVAAAFPLPKKGTDPELEDRNLAVTTETQRFEVLCYNSGLDYGDDEVMDRRGFERASARAGWNIRLLRRSWIESDSEEEEEEDDEEEEDGEWSAHSGEASR